MELLERVVREDGRSGDSRDLKYERVAATDCTRGWRQQFAGEHCILVGRALGLIDAMRERRVDDDDDVVEGMLFEEVANRFVQLRERGRGATFCGDVGSVDDEL